MHFIQLFAIAATATMAAAAPALTADVKPGNIHIAHDEVILTGAGGRHQVMKRSELEKHLASINVASQPPAHLVSDFTTYTGEEINNITTGHLSKRDVTLLIPGKTETFSGWDVQVSNVVRGQVNTILAVTSGWSISNSISVKTGATLTIIKDFLQTSIDITQQWTTTQQGGETFTTTIPQGKVGCWVFQPLTERHYGQVWQGKVGSPGQVTDFFADKFFPQKVANNMAWVDGIFSPCYGDSFPLKRCHGQGVLDANRS